MTSQNRHPDNSDEARLLNVGCGRNFHPDWVNLDLESRHPMVIEHDVTGGLPFADQSFDAVYHSHVLEHLAPEKGRQLLKECFRVLKPNGVLRIVVPDLERIALLYLDTLEDAWTGNPSSKINYNWMKLELLDQLVRHESGGEMGKYMASSEIENSKFVRERIGEEYSICQACTSGADQQVITFRGKVNQRIFGWKKKLTSRVVRLLMGAKAEQAFREGVFRSQGEVHRWMYDRLSLRELVSELGFERFQVCAADESAIRDFARFELDSVGGQIRKPDSIFIECSRPAVTSASSARNVSDQTTCHAKSH